MLGKGEVMRGSSTPPSLLCVHAHPDDEALWTGGTLARAADAGARTAVVTCTWAAGTRRAGELERALALLGAGPPRLLGYADSRVPESAPGSPRFCDAPLDAAVRQLTGHIREFRPDVVVTYDAYGGYGHEDHIHTHRVTTLAVEAAGQPQLYPEAGEPWRPRGRLLVTLPRSLVQRAWGQLFGTSEPADPAELLPGVPDGDISTTVDVGPWTDRKLAALREHASEAERGAGPALLDRLPTEVRDRVLSTEWYLQHPVAPVAQADAATLP